MNDNNMTDGIEWKGDAPETGPKNLQVAQSEVDGESVAVVSDDTEAGQWMCVEPAMLMNAGDNA